MASLGTIRGDVRDIALGVRRLAKAWDKYTDDKWDVSRALKETKRGTNASLALHQMILYSRMWDHYIEDADDVLDMLKKAEKDLKDAHSNLHENEKKLHKAAMKLFYARRHLVRVAIHKQISFRNWERYLNWAINETSKHKRRVQRKN